MSKNDIEVEKLRLKSLLASECKKLQKNDLINGPPKAKKKKLENKDTSLPIVSCADELVGKRVEHFTFGYDGKEKWFEGVVICVKPDNDNELVIQYDCEKTFYSFEYSDFSDGLVGLLPLTVKFLKGKKVRQRFRNDQDHNEETNSWWEIGVIVDAKKKS